jgi:trimeric autotransporter adhesin
MKNSRAATQEAILLMIVLIGSTSALAQITPSGDAYIDTTKPTVNFGTAVTLGVVSPAQTTFIAFDLSSIPSGFTGSSIAQATLKLYVSSVTTAGSFNVDLVNGSWTESTLTANNAPALGATIAASVPLTKSHVRDYILIDITQALQDWLNGTPNDGIALVANSPFGATIESKENVKESHPAELDVVFASGNGTITGVNTAAGSGLTGGGTSGTLNLSLLTNCSSGQTLRWSGSAWECANAGGTGTVTSVGSGLGLTGGPITTSGTLTIDPTVVPLLNASNIFSGNQAVNGNLSATGLLTGAGYQIGSNLFAFGSYNNSNAYLGFAGNTTTTGHANTAAGVQALYSNTNGVNNTALGGFALYYNTGGYENTATGAVALFNNTTGYNNSANGAYALTANTTGTDNTATGYRALYSNSTGYENTATGSGALYSNTTPGGNTADGYEALYNLNSVGVNSNARNTATGERALYSNTVGVLNSAHGGEALYSNTYGGANTADGFQALYSNTTGGGNTASGYGAGSTQDFTSVTGSGNTFLGYNAGMSTGSLSNATAIGSNALVSQSNSLVLGNGANVGIGTSAPFFILQIAPGLGDAVADGWATWSSRRWKTNIRTLSGALGKVERLRGVSYDRKDSGKHEIGVIAEEVGAVLPEVVSWEKNGKDAQGVDYSRLTALLIEAMKQQQGLIRQQEKQIREQRAQLAHVATQLGTLQAMLETIQGPGSTAHTASGDAKAKTRTGSPIAVAERTQQRGSRLVPTLRRQGPVRKESGSTQNRF